jgi:hypothetical protein
MTTRPTTRRSAETGEWPVAIPRTAAPLMSPRAVERAVRRLEDALSALDLAPRLSARARGAVRPVARAD